MYLPATFREDSLAAQHALIRAHPLGVLVAHGPAGLQATPLPFLLDADAGERGVLRAHLARANPLLPALGGGECLVIFQGADAYITPSWYASKATTHRTVPTWNYAAVHAWGTPRLVDDAPWLRRQLADLTRTHETERAQPWSISDAPPDYIATQMKAIVGIEIPIARSEGKWKMSQNKDDADRAGVVAGLRDPDDPHGNPAVADLVAARGGRR